MIYEMFTKDVSNTEKVEFVCKPYDPKQLIKLDQESMNSYGQTKLFALIDYIFYQEGCYKYVKGCKTYSMRKKVPEPECLKVACQYMELVMKPKIVDD